MAIDYSQYKEYLAQLEGIAEDPEADTAARTLAMAALVLDKGLVDVVQTLQDQSPN